MSKCFIFHILLIIFVIFLCFQQRLKHFAPLSWIHYFCGLKIIVLFDALLIGIWPLSHQKKKDCTEMKFQTWLETFGIILVHNIIYKKHKHRKEMFWHFNVEMLLIISWTLPILETDSWFLSLIPKWWRFRLVCRPAINPRRHGNETHQSTISLM